MLSCISGTLRILAASESIIGKANSRYSETALHELAFEGAPAPHLQVLLEKCPEAASMKDRFGRTPLHCAVEGYAASELPECDRICYEETVNCLLRAFPMGMTAIDDFDKTPLVCACEKNVSLSLIYQLFSVDPISNLETLRGPVPPPSTPTIRRLARKRKRSSS